MINLSIKA